MKPWAYVVLALAVIAAFGGTYAAGHGAGYDKRENELANEIIEAQEKTRKEEEVRWAAAVEAALSQVRTEEVIVERINVVEKEIPKIVERVRIERPECADTFGPAFSGVLNDQVRGANGVSESEAAAGVVDGLQGNGRVPDGRCWNPDYSRTEHGSCWDLQGPAQRFGEVLERLRGEVS